MATDTKTVLRLQQIQDAWWRWFATMRLIVADCQSNEDLMRGILEENNLPISFDNIEKAWEGLTDAQKAMFAKPSSESTINLRHAEEPAPVVPAAPVVDEDTLPAEYTKRTISKMDRDEYKQLLKKYGAKAIENRANGVN